MMYANIWISAYSNKSNMRIISEYTMRIRKIYANMRFEFIYDHVSGQFLHKKSEYDTQLRKYMHIFGLYSNMGMSANKVRIRFSGWENMCTYSNYQNLYAHIPIICKQGNQMANFIPHTCVPFHDSSPQIKVVLEKSCK